MPEVEVRSDAEGESPPSPATDPVDDTDLDPRRDDDTVHVVVGHDALPGRIMPQPVVREIPRRARADLDASYWCVAPQR
jgi:hypothetical protein